MIIEMKQGVIFGNRIADVVLISCILAQVYKIFTPLLKGKKIQWSKVIQTGGMPSSHAASVISLLTSVGIVNGTKSVGFAISAVLAGVVLYDATGIRAAAGEHAKALNKLVESIEKKDGIEIIEKKFKEFLGHTPLEVLVGSIFGFIMALLFKSYLLA